MSRPVVALFRAAEDAQASARALQARGVGCVLAPVVETRGVAAAFPAGAFDFAVATSAKAFAFAPPDVLAAARALPLCAVGERTAQAAVAAGFALAGPAEPDVATLAAVLPAGRALYLAGADRKPDLEAALGARGATLVVYEARARTGWDARESAAVAGASAALHYSERSAELAARLAQQAGMADAFRRLPHVCLSRAVARGLAALGPARALWPSRPNEPDLIDALETALADFAP